MHRISMEHDGEAAASILTAAGELDAYTAPALRETLEGMELRGGSVLLDLTAVTFLDSTALGTLVGALKTVGERGGKARVVLPETTARRIFEITTLDTVLPVSASRAVAEAELRELARSDPQTRS